MLDGTTPKSLSHSDFWSSHLHMQTTSITIKPLLVTLATLLPVRFFFLLNSLED